MSVAPQWNELASHFDLHAPDVSGLDFASAANRLIAWPAILSLVEGARSSSGRAVDFGCGTGGLCERLRAMGFRAVGLDQSASMIDVARAKTSPAIEYRIGSHADLPSLGPAQVLTCSLVLNYLPRLDDFARDAEALLSPGGIMVTADLNRPYIAECLAARLIYEDFDSLDEPRAGVLNFGNGVSVPLTIRSEGEYDDLLLPRGWTKAGAIYPPWPREYVSTFEHQFPAGYPLSVPKYQVLAYRRTE